MFRLIGLVMGVVLLGANCAFAQSSWSNYSLNQTNGPSWRGAPIPAGAASPTDFVELGRGPLGQQGYVTPFSLPLGSFASSSDVQALSGRVDQAFQQFQQTQLQLQRGISAAVAMTSSPMPSMPGRTSWAVNAATFEGQVGAGFSFAHRLNFSVPLAVTAAYGNGGGNVQVGRIGLMGEF